MSKSNAIKSFDEYASRYDAWFDTPRGQAIFESELQCLRPLVAEHKPPGLEVGVGTGRFAQALEIEHGIDPSSELLKIASDRGIKVQLGSGENLPYEDELFGLTIIVVTLCFASKPEQLLQEAARVTRQNGRVVVGIVPSNSLWGRKYSEMAKQGHHLYKNARFFTVEEVVNLAKSAGLRKTGAYSTLVADPDDEITQPKVYPGTIPTAGFVAISFQRIPS
jgi:ubiquinone/menaquinone biosynthesis C-methylase UbiE